MGNLRENTVMSLDIGTTSSRVVIYDALASPVAVAQRDHARHFPQPGWVESDPQQIWNTVRELTGLAMVRAGIRGADVAAIGITNQRETTIAWDKTSGTPAYPAIIWQDTRTESLVDQLKAAGIEDTVNQHTGLKVSSYFSALKMRWLFDHVPEVRELAEGGNLALGTVDSWILWNLTGGPGAGVHATDITNASRTLLMDIESGAWSQQLISVLGLEPELVVPALPEVKASSTHFGEVASPRILAGTPVTGILGDQQAAAFGQAVFSAGEAKNTYGTGCFVVHNTGSERVSSSNGLLTTVAYQLQDQPIQYALEGSVAHTGSVIQWLQERLGLFSSAQEIDRLAASVEDNGGVYFVPAFSGLFAPYWRQDARGSIFGLTDYVTKAHIARAGLEATAFQSADVLRAVFADTGHTPELLKVDGGMSVNSALMQFQADLLGVSLARPADIETTARGAASAAGLAVGLWGSLEELRSLWSAQVSWEPDMGSERRENLLAGWSQAIEHTVGWQVQDTSGSTGV